MYINYIYMYIYISIKEKKILKKNTDMVINKKASKI